MVFNSLVSIGVDIMEKLSIQRRHSPTWFTPDRLYKPVSASSPQGKRIARKNAKLASAFDAFKIKRAMAWEAIARAEESGHPYMAAAARLKLTRDSEKFWDYCDSILLKGD